ncbi:11808_t:CDS:2 [Ambispora leptoticha]|uniref:11808_t:CDS:1 n=1 Tax=Ambispora leptoticha TaxID=144679 RepID=A0A9N8Z339_9GLOM|nr:11808_t:CDS:2 [Ambispora leptoticha]
MNDTFDPNTAPTKKLTKRQKKTDAFRSRKKPKLDNTEQDSLIIHSQNSDEAQESDNIKVEFVTKDKDKKHGSQLEEETNEKKKQNNKKIKKDMEKKSLSKHRYIVFVANLPYSATKEEIANHFETNGATPISTRLITDKMTKKPKGFAFVEFKNAVVMKHALGFHHTVFKNKKIRVELTSGGGGNKSEFRRNKIEAKNKKLDEERHKLHEKNKKISSEIETGGNGEIQESKNKLINSEDINGISQANIEYNDSEDTERKKRREANNKNIDKQRQKKHNRNLIKSSERRISKPRNIEGSNAVNPLGKMRKFGS